MGVFEEKVGASNKRPFSDESIAQPRIWPQIRMREIPKTSLTTKGRMLKPGLNKSEHSETTELTTEHHARLIQIKEDQAHRTLADTLEYLIDQAEGQRQTGEAIQHCSQKPLAPKQPHWHQQTALGRIPVPGFELVGWGQKGLS